MTQSIVIENLKCGGCANTIKKGVSSVDGITEVNVDVEASEVTFTSENDVLEAVKIKLSKLGYPAVGDKNSTLHKAKSFVSCATGKMSS